MSLQLGVRAPLFRARTHSRPDFAFGSLGGLFILMAFLPDDAAEAASIRRTLLAAEAVFDDIGKIVFAVTPDAAQFEAARDQARKLRYFHDDQRDIAGHFHLTDSERAEGRLILLDPTMRVLANAPVAGLDNLLKVIRGLGPSDDHAGVTMHAPVLIVPRVFEPDFCRRLIGVYEQDGGGPSGVMREIDGQTVGVLDDFKKRRDANISDEELQRQIQLRIRLRLLPEIEKAFVFQVTRMERYIVARYDAEDGGYFKPHRDNNTKGTAHRQFACSINLNAEEFEGGDLRFPEFGRRTYRPPTGGAVIFSCSLLHEATPVTKGSRFAFLPFFYDDAHAKIRDENQKFLGEAQVPAEA